MRFADHFDISNEMMARKTDHHGQDHQGIELIVPLSFNTRSTPSNRKVMLITSNTARLVIINSPIRFIFSISPELRSLEQCHHFNR
jgi:hypothetical protein